MRRLGVDAPRVTFESLLGHFNCFGVLRSLGSATGHNRTHELVGPVALGTSPGLSQGQTGSLKTLTSLNKEVRPFFLGDNSIWSFPSVSSLSDFTAFGGPESYFSLAIIAFGAFQFIVAEYYYRLGKMELKGSSLLI